MNSTLKKSLIATLAFSIATASANASHVHFSYKAHELETSNGIDALYARLEFKATQACDDLSIKPLYAKQVAKNCKSAFIREVVSSIDDRRLNRLHQAATENNKDYALN